jgi:hypothetical protein
MIAIESDNPFVAVLRSSANKQIVLDEAEYAILKELRRIRLERKHCHLQVGYRDGKYTLYEVKLISSFGIDTG